MSAARSARLATSRGWSSVLGSWVPKIWLSVMLLPSKMLFQAGMGGTASPRAHPGTSLPVDFPVGRLVRRFLLALILEPAPFAPDFERGLAHRLDQVRA